MVPNWRKNGYRPIANAFTARRVVVFLCAILPWLVAPASAKLSNPQDSAFVRTASQDETANVKRALLALRKSGNKRVVSLATRIRDVDSQLNRELVSTANAQHVPSTSALGTTDESRIETLEPENGYQFDRDYLTSQLRSDLRTSAACKIEVAKGSNKDLKAFAKEDLPVLDQHIWLAHQAIEAFASNVKPIDARSSK